MNKDPNESNSCFLIRFLATDWDPEVVTVFNEYLATVEVDSRGCRPNAWMDERTNGSLGVHVFPLEGYSPRRQQEIAATCMHLRELVTYDLTYSQKKPFEV